MICKICNNQKDKVVKCKLIKDELICHNCCFSISVGKTELLKYLKENFNWQKEDVLAIGENCLTK